MLFFKKKELLLRGFLSFLAFENREMEEKAFRCSTLCSVCFLASVHGFIVAC
jgi:hypothetical protein